MSDGGSEKRYDWTALYDADGDIYYHNEKTDETTWDEPDHYNPPEEYSEEIKAKEKEGTWEKHHDDDGNAFYYNAATGVTKWAEEEDQDEAPLPSSPIAGAEDEDEEKLPSSPVGGGGTDDEEESDADQADEPRRAGDWEEHEDDEGNKYYHNEKTDETTWDRPHELDDVDAPKSEAMDGDAAAEIPPSTNENEATTGNPEQAEEPRRAGDWEEHDDEEGNKYYHNMVTGETTWDRPPEFEKVDGAKLDQDTDKGTTGHWQKLVDDEGREYYYNSVTEITQWEKPGDFVETAQKSAAGAWEKVTDDEGREYYYNPLKEVTQWEKPDNFVEDEEDKDEQEPMSGVSPHRPPSPEFMETEKEVKDEEEEKEKEKGPQIDPALKKIKDAEESLSRPDSVMEPGCIADLVEVVASEGGNPEKAILMLVDNFQGQTAICGTLAKWLADLQSAETNNGNVNEIVGTAPQSIADAIRETTQNVIDRVAKERFSKTGGDNILNLSKSEAAFLEDMMDSKRWRTLLIDLTATNKDSALLMYCLRAISKRGYHREIVRRINQSEHFSVFNAMLQSELAVVGKTAISASSDVDTSIGLDELVNDLRRTCTATSYTYLYSIEVLRHLVAKAEEKAESIHPSQSLRFRRAIRKWERLSQDLDSAMVDPDTSSSTAGSSHLFRKRRLDVALTVSELHQRQRRRRKPNPGKEEVVLASNDEQAKVMESGLLNFLRRYSVGTQVDDRVLDALLPTGLNMQKMADETGKLLIAHPLAVRALLSHIFTSGSARVLPETKNKCARLIALATLASEKRARSEMLERQIGQEGQDEVALTRMLVQSCQLCESVQLMASFVVTTDAIENGASASPGHQLCALALKCAPVAQGTMLWAKAITKNGEFLQSATYPTFSPSLLSLVRIIALQHPCTRLEAAEIVFIFLTHSSTAEVSYKKINEIKEQCLRLLLFLIVKGEAPSVLRTLTYRLQQQDTIKLDASLLRYFVGGLLQVVRPPYSFPFVRLLGAMLKTAKCIEAIRSAYFGEDNQERLKTMLSHFKESLSAQNGAGYSEDTALVTFLLKTYAPKSTIV